MRDQGSERFRPNPERVRHLRETLEVGLLTARRLAWKENLRAAAANAATFDDLKGIIAELVEIL